MYLCCPLWFQNINIHRVGGEKQGGGCGGGGVKDSQGGGAPELSQLKPLHLSQL